MFNSRNIIIDSVENIFIRFILLSIFDRMTRKEGSIYNRIHVAPFYLNHRFHVTIHNKDRMNATLEVFVIHHGVGPRMSRRGQTGRKSRISLLFHRVPFYIYRAIVFNLEPYAAYVCPYVSTRANELSTFCTRDGKACRKMRAWA